MGLIEALLGAGAGMPPDGLKDHWEGRTEETWADRASSPNSLPAPDNPVLPALSTDFTALINVPKNSTWSFLKAN